MKNSPGNRFWTCVAGLNGLMAIAMGALSAHAIENAHLASIADKASLYQLIHSGVLLALSSSEARLVHLARTMFLVGVCLFCGSLYVLAFFDPSGHALFAPAGGLILMGAWTTLVVGALMSPRSAP